MRALRQSWRGRHRTGAMRTSLSLLALAALLAGCAGEAPPASRSTATAPGATPAATAPAAPAPLIAVHEEGGAGPAALSLLRVDGRPVARTERSNPLWFGVGGGMLTFVEDGALLGLTPAGTLERLGQLPGWSGGPVAVAPDGRTWLWSASSGGGGSALMLGGRDGTNRVVARLTSRERALQPFRWGAAGPTYQQAATGIGGYILFGDGATGPTFLLDPASGRSTALLDGDACHLLDVAGDGTMVCLRADPSRVGRTLDVLSPGGHAVEMALPAPAFTQLGAVSFAPGSDRRLVVGGTAATGSDGGLERYETDVLDSFTRTLHPIGTPGLRPAAGPWNWLPDGSLLAYRPRGASGGEPGVYLIRPDGSTARVSASGTALGVVVAGP
jgi:hypothetical protein